MAMFSKNVLVFLTVLLVGSIIAVPDPIPTSTSSGAKLSFLVSKDTTQGLQSWTVDLEGFDSHPKISTGLQPGFSVYPTCRLNPVCYSSTGSECSIKKGRNIPRLPVGLLKSPISNYFLSTQQDNYANILFWNIKTLPLNHLWATSLKTEQTVLLMESPKIPYIFVVDSSKGIIFWGSDRANGVRKKFISGKDTDPGSDIIKGIQSPILGVACEPPTETLAAISSHNILWVSDYQGNKRRALATSLASSDTVVPNTLGLFNQTVYWFYYKTVTTSFTESVVSETSSNENSNTLPGRSGFVEKHPHFVSLHITSQSMTDNRLDSLIGDEIVGSRIQLPLNSKSDKSCSTGDCPYVCLYDYDIKDDRCACPSWMQQVDQRTCKEPTMALVFNDTRAKKLSEVRTTGISDTLSLTYSYETTSQLFSSNQIRHLQHSSLEEVILQHRIGKTSEDIFSSSLDTNHRSASNPLKKYNLLYSNQPHSLRFESSTNCIHGMATNSNQTKYWSIFCSPALDPEQFAVDLSEPILVWRNIQTGNIHKTLLRDRGVASVISSKTLRGNWLIALDSKNRNVYWLTSKGLQKSEYDDKLQVAKTVFQFEEPCIQSRELTQKHFLQFLQDRLYWIEEQRYEDTSFVVMYDLRLGFKEAVLKAPSNTYINSFTFPSLPPTQAPRNPDAASLCTHFYAPPSDYRRGHCWCPEEMPFLQDGHRCLITPPLLIAKTASSESVRPSTASQFSIDIFETSLRDLNLRNKTTTTILDSLFLLKLNTMNTTNFVFDTNGDVVCWALETVKCISRSSVGKTPSIIPTTSLSTTNRILRLDPTGSALYFNGPDPETINILSLDSTGTLKITNSNSFVSKLTRIYEIDTTRQILFWCNNENRTLNQLGMHLNPQKMRLLWKFSSSEKCQALAINERNSTLFVAMSNQIQWLQYELLQRPNADRYPKRYILHTLKSDSLSDLQYFQNFLLWKIQTNSKKSLSFIAILNLDRPASKALRLYNQSDAGEELLSFRVFLPGFQTYPKQCSHFTFPRITDQSENSDVEEDDPPYMCMCPNGILQNSNLTQCDSATLAQGMSITAVFGYIVAPLLILVPATIFFVYLIVKMCRGRTKKLRGAQKPVPFSPISSSHSNNSFSDPSNRCPNY